MGMTAGTVTVDDDGAVTKTGMAEAIYDALLLQEQNRAAEYGVEIPTGSDGAAALRSIGSLASALAQAIVNYMQSNAKAIIPTTAGGAGLQRTPNPNNANTETQAPINQKELAIS